MNSIIEKIKTPAIRSAIKVVFIYILVGFAYILLSGILVDIYVSDPVSHRNIEIAKGWIFIFLTALMLFLLMVKYNTRLAHSQSEKQKSEQIFNEIMNQIPISCLMKDIDGKYIFANKSWEENVGVKAVDIIGKYDHELFDSTGEPRTELPNDLNNALKNEGVKYNSIKEYDNKVIEQTIIEPFTYVHESNGREKCWLVTKSYHTFSEDQKYIFTSAIDITKQHSSENALRESEAKFRSLIENIPISVVIFSGDKVTYANPEAEKLSGYTQEEFIDKGFWEIAHPDYRELIMERGRQRQQPQENHNLPNNYELKIVRKNGEERWVDYSATTAIIDGKLSVVGLVNDITDRVRAEEARKQLEEQILQSQKMESLGYLAGGIAHDFNNLLMGIISNAKIAQMDIPDSSPAQNSVKELEYIARKAAELTNQLLAYSGKKKIMPGSVDINMNILEISKLMKSVLPKNIAINLDLNKTLAPIVGDPTQIKQILMNLIYNASDAIDGAGEIKVSTGLLKADRNYLSTMYLNDELKEGDYIYIDVEDNGCGIDEETKQKLFDPFFTTKFKGRGLGLASVLGITRSHNGALKVESKVGEGSTFTILLPANKAKNTTRKRKKQDVIDWKASGTVLMVDDEEYVLRAISTMISKWGIETLTAENGKIAIDIYKENKDKIDLVILDLTMPVMDGKTTFEELYKIDPDVKIIMTSGYSEETALDQLPKESFVGFLHKPFMPDQLVKSLKKVLTD